MRQLLAGPFRPVGGMVTGWPPIVVCQRDVGKQYRSSRLCLPEIRFSAWRKLCDHALQLLLGPAMAAISQSIRSW
jgi:hypothetical protein